MDTVEYWVIVCMKLINKEKITKPSAMQKILEMKDFQKSGITENVLSDKVSEIFQRERDDNMKEFRKGLQKLRNPELGQLDLFDDN